MRRKCKLADSWTRRELFRKLGKAAGASSLVCLARILAGCGGSSTSAPPGDGYPGTDDQLMEDIEKAGFLFFWEQADPNTGQVKDRALAAGNDTRTVSQGWTPESNLLQTRWDTYSELMMLYLLAMASPNAAFAIPASSWQAWARPSFSYQGLTYISSPNTPLFTHQYSHAWFDFRNKKDAFADYFQN